MMGEFWDLDFWDGRLRVTWTSVEVVVVFLMFLWRSNFFPSEDLV